MPFKPCKDCHELISDSAKTCPRCGADSPVAYIPARITIHRASKTMGFAAKIQIIYQNVQVWELKNGETFQFDVPPGRTVIVFRNSSSKSITKQTELNAVEGKNYQIEVAIVVFGIEAMVR